MDIVLSSWSYHDPLYKGSLALADILAKAEAQNTPCMLLTYPVNSI